MKICQNCKAQIDDNAAFCPYCGAGAGAQAQPQQPTAAPVQPDIYDHTSEFDPKDISENKVFAMLGYLLGIFGVLIALIASRKSEYTMFHVRQVLKFTVVEVLMGICAVVLCWTLIVPFAAGIMYVVLLVIRIICFFQICSGKAKEPVIIRSLGFLK